MRKKQHHKKKISPTKKWSAKLHLWFGLSVGIIIFIISLSGTLYIFKDEVQNSLRKEAIYVKQNDINSKPLSINLLREKISLELNEKYPVSSVEIPLDKSKSYRFLYYEKSKKGWNYFQQVLINKQVYVNQYTGEIIAVYNEKYDVFNILKYIHWGLLLNSEWGPYVTGIPTVLFIIMLITGIILWWPKNKNARKGRFWFNWENVKKWKRKNYDLHNVLGFYASFIALVMSVTGIYFAYPYVKNTFNLAISGYWELPKEKEIKSPDSLMVKTDAVFDNAALQTEKLYAGSSSFRITLNGKNKKGKELKNLPVTVYGQDGRFSERNLLTFDKYSGKLLAHKPHHKLKAAEKYANANYDVHTGSYFGLFGKIIWFIAGLICTSLPVTGFLVWWGKKKETRKENIMKKAILSAASLGTTMVFGQVKDSLQTQNVDEVVMTASRKKENIKEVPSSITVVGEKQIQSQLTVNSDITSILQYTVPSLGTNSGQTSNTGQTLRGRQVLVLIDGIPQSTPLRNGARDLRSIDPSAIERIEVIKGASSIYGNGADGGIINYITKRNKTDQKISGISQMGFTGQPYGGTLGLRASQLLSGKVNKFDYTLSLAYERTGYMKDADGVFLSPTYSTAKMDNYNGLLKLGYTINDNQRIEASYIGYSSRSDLNLGLSTGKYGMKPTIGEGLGKGLETTPQGTPKNHNIRLSYDNKNLFAGTSLNINLYYQDFKTVYGYSDTFFNGGQSNVLSKKAGARFNFDTQLWNSANSQGEIIYGVDILNDKTVQKLEDGRFWTPDMSMTNIAPFLLAKVDLFKKLTIKAGLRYENIKVNVDDFNTLSVIKSDGTFTKSIPVEGGKLNYNALVGNIGVRYNVEPYINLFASFSQAYSINELGRILRTSTSETIKSLETKPIIVNNYELGATGQLSNWLNYELTSYVSTSKLGASFVQSPDRALMIQRSPEIVYGVEGFLHFTPAKWIQFGGSYSWMEGITSVKDDGDYSTKINNSRISAPKVLAYVQARPVPALSVGLDMLHSFTQNRFSPNIKTGLYSYGEGYVPEYTVFNFKSSYEVNRNWKLSLGIENLFNKKYQPAIAWWTARDSEFVNALGMRGTFVIEYKF